MSNCNDTEDHNNFGEHCASCEIATLRAENERLRAELQAARMPDEVRETIVHALRYWDRAFSERTSPEAAQALAWLDAQRKGGE